MIKNTKNQKKSILSKKTIFLQKRQKNQNIYILVTFVRLYKNNFLVKKWKQKKRYLF